MGMNNINQMNVNPQGQQQVSQAPVWTPQPQVRPVPQYTSVIYNMPVQSIYPTAQNTAQPAVQPKAQSQAPAPQVSSMLKNYLIKSNNQVSGVGSIQAVNNDTSAKPAVWHNDMKDMLRSSKVTMLAVIPRTMNAKDTDGNGLIQGNEVRGTFMNAIDRLDEIKETGINTLHVLPIHPTGKTNAMGTAGSLYAPSDLLKVDPNLKDPNYPGTAEDQFKTFINECHKRDIRVMLDLPSCVSVDFAQEHPELMSYEKNGADKTPGGWQDIRMFRTFDDEANRKLNPHLLELHKKYVDMCVDFGLDGIRADVGRAKPSEFWDVIIPYSRTKDPNFGWLAETYTYEDASPQVNMPYDRPVELMKAGFDSYYGQYHIYDQWTKASDLRKYVNEQVEMQQEFSDKQPRTLIGSFSTHDDQSPMFYGGSPWVQLTSILQSTLPLCNPYFVDGVQSGDYYLYPYEHAYAPETQTDTHECTVHKGRIDIFNPSRKPGGNNPEIGKQMSHMLNLRNGEYNDVITKGSMCWLKPENTKNDEIVAFARQYGDKTLLVVGNRNVNNRNTASLKISDMKEGQVLKDLTLPYGDKSYFQVKDGELSFDIAPSRMHVFEIKAPNIEKDAMDVSKFVNGTYTRVKYAPDDAELKSGPRKW